MLANVTYEEAFTITTAMVILALVATITLRWLLGLSIDEMARVFFFTTAPILVAFAIIMMMNKAVPADKPQGDTPDPLWYEQQLLPKEGKVPQLP